jgi:hypothetical protein
MRFTYVTKLVLPLLCAAASFAAGEPQAQAKSGHAADPLFLTATNGATNYLVVINTRTRQTDYVPTGGAGGVGGNAGGVAVSGKLAAAVNFGSSTVTVFARRGNAMQPVQTIKTTSQPVSVTFGHNHLVVLGQTTAESFPIFGEDVAKDSDGIVQLQRADKSAAQIVVYDGGVMYTEKSGGLAALNLATNGAPGLSGPNRLIPLPAAPNDDTPFGIVARGANAYLAIAHSDRQALIANDKVVSVATSGTTPFAGPNGSFLRAPCWNTLSGQFLYSADSPGRQLLRYLVSDTNVFFDKPAAARFAGPPTDLDVQGKLMGVIDGGVAGNANASVFDIGSEGELTLRFSVRIQSPINGAAIIQ